MMNISSETKKRLSSPTKASKSKKNHSKAKLRRRVDRISKPKNMDTFYDEIKFKSLKEKLNGQQVHLLDTSLDKADQLSNLLKDSNLANQKELLSLLLERAGILAKDGNFTTPYKNLEKLFERV
ncbi:MAG: hypothetical protein WAT92_06080 [Saprospiraceae bacterium]